MKYTIRFVGCTRGAIGIHYQIEAEAEGETEHAAVLALYDRYDHITLPVITAEDGHPVPHRKAQR